MVSIGGLVEVWREADEPNFINLRQEVKKSNGTQRI
jgi:hypothetical protein